MPSAQASISCTGARTSGPQSLIQAVAFGGSQPTASSRMTAAGAVSQPSDEPNSSTHHAGPLRCRTIPANPTVGDLTRTAAYRGSIDETLIDVIRLSWAAGELGMVMYA